MATKSSNPIKEIRADLYNKFILNARTHGQPLVAQAIEDIISKLTLENVKRETADGVTILSKQAKGNAKVGPDKSLDIITIVPDWLKLEKSILRDKAISGLVQVGIRGYEQIPLRTIKEMEELGIRVRPSTGVTSLNLSADAVTLYYTSNPTGSPSLSDRVAIHISGNPGKILGKKLESIRTEWFSDQSALGLQKEEIIAIRVLELIDNDPQQLRRLKEILKNDDIPGDRSWRVALLLHCLQIKSDRLYSCHVNFPTLHS